MHTIIRATEDAMSSSGLTLMPSVSSSKNLSNPALAAGIGPDLLFFFFLLILITQIRPLFLLFSALLTLCYLRKVFYFWASIISYEMY
jgi:hypothetical protein